MASRIRKADKVVVIAGKDKGSVGQVLQVSEVFGRVIVEGVNKVKRHQKPTQANQQGGIITREAPIHISNVMLIDPKTNKPTRVRMKSDKDGNKVRVAARSGADIAQQTE